MFKISYQKLRMNLILIGEEILYELISKLDYSSYCQLSLWLNPTSFLVFRAGCHTYESQWPYVVTPLYCSLVKLENSPNMIGRVENGSHINERNDCIGL